MASAGFSSSSYVSCSILADFLRREFLPGLSFGTTIDQAQADPVESLKAAIELSTGAQLLSNPQRHARVYRKQRHS